ncbi:hypothetical protein [Bifidobacterium choloepi]|uniref:Uncharacterized protein n=1 Tax=Bifidobacterium choloepi TaxID=2614131 RepID=A0A6I5MZ81_9BIFI|nr:hypothetical protein [Bifidobacterium choloepi]NEG69125.1 hypothetical protein [Bifidobacterium choloepi]
MPGWIWWILVAFLIVMLVIGVVYVVRHALGAMHKLSAVGGKVSDRVSQMGVDPDAVATAPEAPIFTQPLSVATERYSDAHAEIIEQRQARRERHMATWQRWLHFND